MSLISKVRDEEHGLAMLLDVENLVELKGFKWPLEEPLWEPLEPNIGFVHEYSLMSKSLSSSKVDFIISKRTTLLDLRLGLKGVKL